MADYKNAFFIKEGPKEVDFDMDRIFLQRSVGGRIISLRSEEIKELLDEKLLKFDDALKKRHGELVDYLREVDTRISRVEEEILNRNLKSRAFDNPNLKVLEDFITSQNELDIKVHEANEVTPRKENNLPNIAIDQEELDALLEGLNEISKDNKESSNGSNNLDEDISLEEFAGSDLNTADIDASYEVTPRRENNISNVDNTLASKEDVEVLDVDFESLTNEDILAKSSLVALEDVAENDSEVFNLIENFDGDEGLVDVIGDEKIVNRISDNISLDGSGTKEVIREENVEFSKENNLEVLDNSLEINEVSGFGENLETSNNEEREGRSEELNSVSEVSDHEIDNFDINVDYDSLLSKENDGDASSVLSQEQGDGGISSGFKKLDDFEDVLKTDLNCADLQDCIQEFEEGNLYDNGLRNLEEKLEQGERLGSYSSVSREETEDIRDDNDFHDLSFADIDTIVNKFDDNEYLSRIELSDEERIVLVRFIGKLESELATSPKGNNFKVKREYEILRKIKRLLVRE
ncbi:hypothetical protein CR532_03935 [Candidatus Borreliella tachyglossi]|uniref:Uncharacterized protein n=1 Tax=Candidatus Borreliella tachyglossi TaxID=1964448 RepID=A0A2S1LXU6_9SPIR|nr:hypothetical protein [Candidatus Borreliella tachyglossi]AWG43100.1 hypothetical protein CR532_03935 [Candidatus Borreliella tachyglossi]